MNPDQFPSHAVRVQALHARYCAATAFDLALNYVRIRAWHDWLKWGDWNEADLALVIGYLRRKIAAGDRNPGSLKFSNLIEQPDRFEEDLALARSENRIRRPDSAPAAPFPSGWRDYLKQHYPEAVIPTDPNKLPDYIQKEIRAALRH